WDIAPEEVTTNRAPGRPLSPERASVQAQNRRVTQLVLEPLIEYHHVGIRVALGFRVRSKITRESSRSHARQTCQRTGRRKKRPPVIIHPLRPGLGLSGGTSTRRCKINELV